MLTPVDTPAAGEGSVQAEISLPESQVSADGQNLTITVSVTNVGPSSFTVRMDDVSLTPEGGQPMKPDSADPALPRQIAADATETFRFVFPRPGTNTAVLRLFDTEFDVEGF